MERQKILQQITSLMQEHGIKINEVIEQLQIKGQAYDLLCNIDGKLTRVTYNTGKDLNPVGIFPFIDSNQYLELEETPETTRCHAEERRLPQEAFCERLYTIRKPLNATIAALNKPILKGTYFAIGHFYVKENWIVGFDDNSTEILSSDYYGEKELAKIRYVGVYH